MRWLPLLVSAAAAAPCPVEKLRDANNASGFPASTEAVADEAGRIYGTQCEALDCRIYALDDNGKTRWEVTATAENGQAFIPQLWRELLILHTMNRVDARRVSDGKLVWSHDLKKDAPLGLETRGVPFLMHLVPFADSLVTVFPVKNQALIVALGPDGGRRWRHLADQGVQALVADGARLWARGERTFAVDSAGAPAAGQPSFAVAAQLEAGEWPEAVLSDGKRLLTLEAGLAGDAGKTRFIMYSADGKRRWSWLRTGDVTLMAPRLTPGGLVWYEGDGLVTAADDGRVTPLCKLEVAAYMPFAVARGGVLAFVIQGNRKSLVRLPLPLR
jgi:outer membrane protein assembly factor BamB